MSLNNRGSTSYRSPATDKASFTEEILRRRQDAKKKEDNRNIQDDIITERMRSDTSGMSTTKGSGSTSAPNLGGGGGLTGIGASAALAGSPVAGAAIAGLGVLSDISKRRAQAANQAEEARFKNDSARLDRIQTALNRLANAKYGL